MDTQFFCYADFYVWLFARYEQLWYFAHICMHGMWARGEYVHAFLSRSFVQHQ